MPAASIGQQLGGIIGKGMGGAMGGSGGASTGFSAASIGGASSGGTSGAKAGGSPGVQGGGYGGDIMDLVSKIVFIIGNHTGSKKKQHVPPRMQQSALSIPRMSEDY